MIGALLARRDRLKATRTGVPSRLAILLAGLALVVAALIPLFIGSSTTRVLIVILMYAVLAQAWNLIGGYAGYASFGHVAFFGVCAYGTGILMATYQWPLLLALTGGTLIAVALAALVSPVLRLQGHYFVVMTFAVAEATREIVMNWNDVTGGGRGIMMPIAPGSVEMINRYMYYAVLGLLVAVILTTYFISRSRLGYALIAIRENEAAAEQTGVDTVRVKAIAFLVSALFSAIPGGLYGYWQSFIDPVDVFSIGRSITSIVAVLLGGSGTLFGPTIGAIVLLTIGEFAWSRSRDLHEAILGIIVILVVLFLPAGIMAQVREGWRGLHPARLRERLKRYRV